MKEVEINKLELQAEELECVHLFLDDKNIPRGDKNGIYSTVGRINWLLNQAYLDANHDIEQLKTK